METKRNNDAVNERVQDSEAAVAELEKIIQQLREGKIPGLIVTFQEEGGKRVHKLLGSYTEDPGSAMEQVGHLDAAVRRFFLCPPR